ncbi:MAG: hypothetical protein AAFY71_07270 [Bacteroidota bacterium]
MKKLARLLAVIGTTVMLCLGVYEIFFKTPTAASPALSVSFPLSEGPAVSSMAPLQEEKSAPVLPQVQEKEFAVTLLGDSYLAQAKVYPENPRNANLYRTSKENIGQSAWLSKFGVKGDNFFQMYERYKQHVMPLQPDLTVFMLKRKDLEKLRQRSASKAIELEYSYSEQGYYQNEQDLGKNQLREGSALQMVSNASKVVSRYQQWDFLLERFSSLFFGKTQLISGPSDQMPRLFEEPNEFLNKTLAQLAQQNILLVGLEPLHPKDVEFLSKAGLNYFSLYQLPQKTKVDRQARRGFFEEAHHKAMGLALSKHVQSYFQEQ